MKKYIQLAKAATEVFYDKDYNKLPAKNKDGHPCLDQPVFQTGFENGVETLVPVAARIARTMGNEEIAKQIEKLLEQEV